MNTLSRDSQTEPVAARMTPRGRGAVATIRFRGDCRLLDGAAVLFRAANRQPLSQQPINRIVFGRWGSDPAEDVVVCRVDRESLEIHCHGGEAAVGRILDGLKTVGCSLRSWQDLLAQTEGRFEAEWADALGRATTVRTADLLLQQHSGGLRAVLQELENLPWTGESRRLLGARLSEILEWSEFGLHLTRPWSVVLAGRPNVGKSSLINALVGYSRSIVYDQPGTTRDVVTAETAFDGWPIEFADTAGIRDEAEELESAGIGLARARLAAADCRLLLLEVSERPQPEDERLLAEWPEAIVVAHKSDLPSLWGDALPTDALPVSSLTGTGIDDLAGAILKRLIPRVPPPGTPTPFTQRQIDLLEEARTAVETENETAFRAAVRKAVE